MGRPKPVAQDLLADLPVDVDAPPTQTMPPPKPKRTKKAHPKAKATEVEVEDTLTISQLAGSEKTTSVPKKRSAETQPSESAQSKKPRSSSATISGSRIPKVPWTPEITLEDKPVLASDSADDINVGVALSTALLFPSDLERNAKMSEYENYAFMLQRFVQLNIPEDSPLRKAEAIPLPFPPPPPPPSQTEEEFESESEDEEEGEDEALVRKSKEVVGSKSPSLNEQVLDLTQDDDGDAVAKETSPEQASSDVPPAEKSLDETLAQIDAEIEVEKTAEIALQESAEVVLQESAEVQSQIAPEVEES
ncbi:adenomatous polyposis coli protein-like [Camellia sinensis]|uniref:adenomatous polyposis coli protein-like n=1 Tax=Camellia sinensis TaxID=4442 RepID=UPI0010356A83|nr:adenomatous polyposis coli protein-like [Camellia sinensis]